MFDNNIEYLQINQCIPFKGDLFECNILDDKFEQLVYSIGTIGLVTPIIARRVNNCYEVVVGRLRLKALEYLGIEVVPAIVRDLTDVESEILVIETNINQRCIDNFKHSQIAEIVYRYHSLIKKQGRRSDLLRNVQKIISEIEGSNNATFSPVGEKLNSAVESGKKFSLSARTISRYLRVYLLCDELKQLLDYGYVSLRTAVELSFLDVSIQYVICDIIRDYFVVKYNDAIMLREYYQLGILNKDNVANVLNGMRINKTNYSGFKPMKKLFDKYSLGRFSNSELETLLDEALHLYFVEVLGDCSKVSWCK